MNPIGQHRVASNSRALSAAIALFTVAAIAFVVAYQLSPYAGRTSPGMSFDTAYYAWRTNLVASEGTPSLTSFPEATIANPERPGFPVMGAITGAVAGVDGLTFAIVIRAFAAAAIGLAAAGVAVAALGLPAWVIPMFAIGLGTSAAVTGTAIGSLENMLADVPLMMLGGVVAIALADRRGPAAIPILTGGAALVHWVFAVLLSVLAVATGLIATVLARGGGRRRQLVRTGVIAGLLLVGIVSAAALLPAAPSRPPPLFVQRSTNDRLGLYELWVVLPLAAVGLVLTLRHATGVARTAVIFLGIWAASIPVAMAISELTPLPLKVFRVAPFALGAPVLIVAGLVVLIREAGGRWGWLGAIGGVVIAAVAIAVALPPQVGPYNDRHAALITGRIERAAAIGRYLEGEASSRGLVVVVPVGAPAFDRAIRAGLPPPWIHATRIYLGDPVDLFAGRPMDDPRRPNHTARSREWWAAAWPRAHAFLARDPIVIGVQLRDPPSGAPALAPGVRVLRGPAPTPVEIEPIHLSWFRAGWIVAILFAVTAFAGFGWTVAVLDLPVLPVALFSPAMGVALLALAGSAVGRFGVALGGPPGVLVAVGVGLAGALAAWLRRRRPAGPD